MRVYERSFTFVYEIPLVNAAHWYIFSAEGANSHLQAKGFFLPKVRIRTFLRALKRYVTVPPGTRVLSYLTFTA